MTSRLGLLLLFFLCSPLTAEEPALLMKSFPPEAELYLGGRPLLPEAFVEGEDGAVWRRYGLRPGYQVLTLRATGYKPKWLHIRANGTLRVDEKLERADSLLRPLGEVATGSRPKGVAFSPDSRFLVVTGLSDTGIELYRSDPLEHIGHRRLPPEGGEMEGFVEPLFLPRRGELWISQMSTGEVHLLEGSGFDYVTSVSTGGRWPKVMVSDPDERFLYVSNWLGRSVGVIDLEERTLVETIDVPGVPRGMAVSRDGKHLYVALFEGGDLLRIDLRSSERPVRRLEVGDGALRHLVLSKDGQRLYVSDMYYGRVLLYDLREERVLHSRRLGANLNTIALTPDGRYLLVSERGVNHPEDYTLEGPRFGRVFLCDAETLEPVTWVWGRNQPTGLAVSPDGRLVAFSDFMDDNLELYELIPSSPRRETNRLPRSNSF